MRYSEIIEGEVVDLGAHRMRNALSDYGKAMRGIFKAEYEHFKGNKFLPFAQAYIESGFDPEYEPEFFIDVMFRDYRPTPEARALLDQMKKQKWEIIRTKYAKGYNSADKEGPLARKERLSFEEARELWLNRNSSPYGAYQRSSGGFRSSRVKEYDERGVGFSLLIMGRDARRQRRGGEPSEEYHVIDDNQDWAEAVEMMALIRRAQIR